MTTRKFGSRRSGFFSSSDRLRAKRRRQDRKGLLETLEQRQLLAGPDLIGIQPNQGSLLFDGGELTVRPKELVFQFDELAKIDPSTLDGIQITRAGGDGQFEAAESTTDFGTGGAVLVDFRAVQSGVAGNGITLQFTSANRSGSSLPTVQVAGTTISVELNSNPARETTVAGLLSALRNNPQASALVTGLQVTGGSSTPIGRTTPNNLTVVLGGANAATAVTDLGTGNAVRVRVLSTATGPAGRGQQLIVERRNFLGPALPAVLVSGNDVRVQVNSFAGNETTVAQLITAINSNPQASKLLRMELQAGSSTTKIGNVAPTYSPLTLGGASDIQVMPGYIGLGDSAREVVFRFSEPLPDDKYQINVFGTGATALTNIAGEAFQDGQNFGLQFDLDLGPQVLAVVPEPIRRGANGALSPDVGVIEVHFSDDDLNPALAQDPAFYRLFYTRGTANGNDDVLVTPTSVSYSAVTNIAKLQFAQPLARVPDPDNAGQFLSAGVRLRIGQKDTGPSVGTPLVPQDITLQVNDAGDSFATAYPLGNQFNINAPGSQTLTFQSEIVNATPFGLDLPAGPAVPGVSTPRPEDPTRLDRIVPLDYLRRGADRFDGISTIYYDFAPSFLGDDPNSPGIDNETTYFNIISEEQKDRVREALHQFSEYLGIQFVETNGGPAGDAFFTIAVGDLYGGNPAATSGDGGLAVVTRDRNGDGIDDLGVMDFQDFDESNDDQFGGEFFRGAMLVVGQMLGYGYADDLPQPVTQSSNSVFNPGTDNEAAFPSIADIVNGQFMYRPDSTDVDLYQFQLTRPGKISIQTLAERLPEASLLDTALRLYRELPDGTFEEVAANDDYFSKDSLIELQLSPGNYVVGVSASGNSSYDPAISGTGFGGRTEGSYELRLNFVASDNATIRDTTGKALDGDADGRPGGVYNFWFVPADPSTTLFVDKSARSVGNGSIGSPFRDLDDAIARAQPGQTVRVVANGGADGLVYTPEDNLSYQVGVDAFGDPLQDGSTLTVPQGVTLVVDAGVVFKMQRSRVGIGSTAPTIDYSGAALQLLGTPTMLDAAGRPVVDAEGRLVPGSVIFTSFNDDTVGAGNTPSFTPVAKAGDWGGLDFRGDLDAADESRFNPEAAGMFLNQIQFADIRYGGGRVSVDGRSVVISPVDMAITRPTVVYSTISHSADAAMAATPDTFAETRFDEPDVQAVAAFVPDYARVGPDIHNNLIIENSINGLFVRVRTRAGSTLQPLTSQARFDDTDIVHVLTENLVIAGTPGGPLVDSNAPSILLVNLSQGVGSSVPAGSYAYRVTNVQSNGQESAASTRTASFALTAPGAIRLTQLPRVPADGTFVSRRLYRATVTIDPLTGAEVTGPFQLVAQLNASTTTYVDNNATPGITLVDRPQVLRARLDGRLDIDPGTVVKFDSARIEARFGAQLLAEGEPGLPIVFTSLEDQRYGGSGTFDTNDRGMDFDITPGDWGGLYFGQGATASFDNVVIAGAGGTTRVEGGFADFNAIEVHQADLRLANSKFEFNADGQGTTSTDRVGRGSNAAGTVFVRAATPILVNNQFIGGEGAAITVDINSLSYKNVADWGRSTGYANKVESLGNAGPLVRNNRLDDNDVNGMRVRGGELATQGVWDDYDIVHVVRDMIEVPNQFVYGGLQLRSDARGSLVVKFQDDQEPAGLVVGGNLLTAEEQLRGIADRIGGSLQLIGHPDFPVVLTTLADDFSGAGFTPAGLPQLDTNNDGLIGGDLSDQIDIPRLPAGPEVNNGLLIDNDVATNTAGFFNFLPGPGGEHVSATTTVQGLTQLFQQQNSLFDYGNFIDVGADGGAVGMGTTTITMQPTLIADDRVASEGNFQGANGLVNWRVEQYFDDGGVDLISEITFNSTQALGDIRFINYYDPVIGTDAGDILFAEGTPGQNDFRLTILDGPEEIGFRQYGTFVQGPGLAGASYEGWIADAFPDLITAPEFNLPFVPTGTVDQASVPLLNDPRFPTPNYGPEITTSALAWLVDPTATSATITTNLQVIAEVFGTSRSPVSSGLWNGVTVREAASDRNVAAVAENESVAAISPGTNAIPGQSQFLGELAPSESQGDENRRIGFVVDGFLAKRDDVDVYSFVAESGTQVWFDIDRTANSLDAVLELVDANGLVLARSNDSLAEEADPSLLFVSNRLDADSVRPMSEVGERTETQVLTIGGNVADAAGFLNISLFGSARNVQVDIQQFLANPAGSVQAAINSTFAATLGPVEVTLARRAPRVVDPLDPTNVLQPGGDYELQVRFDNDLFLGTDVPDLAVDDSLLNLPGGGTVAMSTSVVVDDNVLQDLYSTNRRDPGMRIVLPGETGTRNLYHVRVRSNDSVANPGVRNGLTSGNYSLQVRLRELDESPGTQVRFADVRYATTGLQIIGQPFHSPLLGEDYEQSAPNDTFGQAQRLGPYGVAIDSTTTDNTGPLSSDRLSKSVGGMLDSEDDIDWYQFDVQYERLTRDNAALYLATVFDLDYADNFARADMAFYIFDAAGNLIMTAGDSNIADDQPRAGQGVDGTDLSRGSAGTLDPYLGTTELSEGSYFVAVSNQTRIPQQLDQFFVGPAANPLLRLEPIDSVVRIAEDRIDSFGGGTAADPQVPVLFDPVNAIIDYTFDDVVLYTIGRSNTGTQQTVNMINPFTGENYGSIGVNNQDIADFAFLPNGELFGYNRDLINGNPPNDTGVEYHRINSENASLTNLGPSNIETYEVVPGANPGDPPQVIPSDEGVHPEAMTFFGDGLGFFVGNRIPASQVGTFPNQRPAYFRNILYQFDPQTGQAFSGAVGDRIIRTFTFGGQTITYDERGDGAGTQIRERGYIETRLLDTQGNVLNPNTALRTQFVVSGATSVGANGQTTPLILDNFAAGGPTTFTIIASDQTPYTFEFDSGPEFTYQYNHELGAAIRDGDQISVTTLSGTRTYEFNTGPVLTVDNTQLVDGARIVLTDANGVQRTFELDQNGSVSSGAIAVSMRDVNGVPLSDAAMYARLADTITRADFAVVARATQSLGRINLSNDSQSVLPVVSGSGLAVEGSYAVTPGLENSQIRINENATAEQFAAALAASIGDGVTVGYAGNRINFRGALDVEVTALQIANIIQTQTGAAGVTAGSGNFAVPFSVSDRDVDIAVRVAQAINNAGLGNISATTNGRTVSVSNAAVTRNSVGPAFEVLNVSPGGTITGIATIGGTLYAVSDNGGLYSVNNPTAHFQGNIGDYVDTATDLVGIPFTGLVRGPQNVDGGRYANLLFGTTANGRVYAFNTAGELQPVFFGGQTNIDANGNGGVRGLAFSTLDRNLWGVTGTRGGDAGHGINPTFSGTRGGEAGGSSLYFGYERNNTGFPNANVTAPRTAIGGNPLNVPRQDGQSVDNTYNFPGGAYGALESNTFDLVGYSAADQPHLYFNYYLESDDGLDAFRVYVITEDGAEHLVSTNASFRGIGLLDDQYDEPTPLDNIDVEVQEAFDNTGTWRQARIPLNEFAGREHLRLRVEFSSSGQVGGGDASIRALPGRDLRDGQQFTISGQEFYLSFGPTIVTPPGSDIAAFYAAADGGVPGSAPDSRVTVNVGGVTFVLNDGFRNVDTAAGEVEVLLFDPAVLGATPLAQLSASEVAAALASVVELNPPAPTVNTNFDFTAESNDELVTATPLPLPSGDATFSGVGRIENVQDVDLFRVDLPAGATLEVTADPQLGSALTPLVRVFDSKGNVVRSLPIPPFNPGNPGSTVDFRTIAQADTTYFIGISSNQNTSYNPTIAGSGTDGDVGNYTAQISVSRDFRVLPNGNRIEVTGGFPVSVPADSPLSVEESLNDVGLPVTVDSSMSATQVAAAIRYAAAQRFAGGQLTGFGSSGSLVEFTGLSVDDSGPFGVGGNRYGDAFGSEGPGRTRNNVFEGVYIDDIIIGLAERGELVTGSTVSTGFIVDPSPNLTNPPQPVSSLVTGSYQLEIRDASEYVASLDSETFRALDTNARLAKSQTITAHAATDLVDGATFTIGDGNATVTFEFDLVESGTGVAPGRVAIPYTFLAIKPGTEDINPVTGLPIPGTGLVRPQTASEVAKSIVAAINSAPVQSVLNVSAQPASGLDTVSDPRVNLLGLSLVGNNGGALANVVRLGGRGDENREREAQGVILVENSRFLFNSQYGIDLVHDVTADVAGNSTNSLVRYPRNLIELNTEALVPGVVVQSNVLAFNDVGGLRVSGIANGGSDLDPVPFDRIINNTIIGGSITPGVTAPAEMLQGVVFSQGALSFADAVTSYLPLAGGGPAPDPAFQNPSTALGQPDGGGRGAEPAVGDRTVSLGNGGVLVLEFIDNRLTGSGDSRPDLAIFETGTVESVLVEVSRDGVTFTQVGIADGLSSLIDIDAAGFGPQDRLAFVRLTDLRQGDPASSTIGADIDAVGAIFSASVDTFLPGGTGITVRQNASPTLLNNVIANSDVGLDVDAGSGTSVLGASTFYRNTTAFSGTTSAGTFPQIVPASEELFVGAGELIFTPSSGASIIDASIDSLQDRASLVTVRNPLGLPPSPIIAPSFDVNGQLRVDDPNVESPFGSGELVFKDRGAEDRGDEIGPRAILTSPRASEQGFASGVVNVVGAPKFFEIQLVDGIAPSDPVPGVGIDDRSVSGDSILLLRNGVPLIDGIDYRFGYNPSTNTIRLTPLAGVFRTDSVYVIRMLDATDSVIQALAGNATRDGGTFTIVDRTGVATPFEYETGITLTVPPSLPNVVGTDGATFTVTDGSLLLKFELNDDLNVSTDTIPVPVPVNATVDQIATAIADAINRSALNLTAVATGSGQVGLTGNNPLSAVDPLASTIVVSGAIGTAVGFGIGIPANVALPAGVDDGQTFVIRRGSVQEVTFEIDSNNSLLTPGAVRVDVPANPTMDQLANALVAAISGSGLGLAPINVGGGRVVLGGDMNYSLDMSGTVLTQLGIPGQVASVPVVIAPDATAMESAASILNAVAGAALPGISVSQVGSRVYIDGSSDVTGNGVLNLVTIRDEVGNLLQSNQPSGQTELTVFVGAGFDYGDAPDTGTGTSAGNYRSTMADGGPRLTVDNGLRIGATVTADADAKIPDGDLDDGVSFGGSFQRGFSTTINVDVNSDGLAYVLDILVDWNGDGDFDDADEARSFNSPFLGSTSLTVPENAKLGTTYARVILTGQRIDPTTNQATSVGEIEDVQLVVQSNPYQNPNSPFNVNGRDGITPLDALLVINALNRFGGASIPLDPPPAGLNLPPFPDVDGNGAVEPRDALLVINELNRLYRNGAQGESAGSNSSVFDGAASMGVEGVLDTLAGDQVQSASSELAVDQLFSEMGN